MKTSISLATTLLFALTVSAAPLVSSKVVRDGQCTFEVDAAHSNGGGGIGQEPIDSVSSGQTVKSPAGKTLIQTTQDVQAGHGPIVFKAADWHGADDVTALIGYDRAADHFNVCQFQFQGQTLDGQNSDHIDSGTVSVASSKCTISLPCDA